jgi:hypothetical protein
VQRSTAVVVLLGGNFPPTLQPNFYPPPFQRFTTETVDHCTPAGLKAMQYKGRTPLLKTCVAHGSPPPAVTEMRFPVVRLALPDAVYRPGVVSCYKSGRIAHTES